jgi:hypothetical protein
MLHPLIKTNNKLAELHHPPISLRPGLRNDTPRKSFFNNFSGVGNDEPKTNPGLRALKELQLSTDRFSPRFRSHDFTDPQVVLIKSKRQ